MFLLVFHISKTNFLVKRDPKRAKRAKLHISKTVSCISKVSGRFLIKSKIWHGSFSTLYRVHTMKFWQVLSFWCSEKRGKFYTCRTSLLLCFKANLIPSTRVLNKIKQQLKTMVLAKAYIKRILMK